MPFGNLLEAINPFSRSKAVVSESEPESRASLMAAAPEPASESRASLVTAAPEPAPESRASLKDGAVPNPDALSLDQMWISTLLGGAVSSAGVNVNRSNALGVSTVFACVDVLSRSVASLPLNIYRRLPGDSGRLLAVDHPLFTLLHDAANPEMTSSDFRRALQANQSLHGNGYALVVRNGFGEIVELQPVPAWEVDVRKVGRSIRYVIQGNEYDSFQVIHVRGTSFNGLLGWDVMHEARESIGLAAALDRNAGYFFKNGSFPGGFLEHPGQLSAEASLNLQESFSRSTGGSNAHKTRVLEEGMTYREGRSKNNESQFDESRDRQAKDIARIFGVPQHKVGIIGNQPRANVEQENISYIAETLRPILVGWEQAFNQKLLSREERAEYYIEFNLSGLLRGDFKSQNESFALGRQWGWFSVNDVRKMLNMNPIGPEGDVYLQPLNMVDSSNPNPDQGQSDE